MSEDPLRRERDQARRTCRVLRRDARRSSALLWCAVAAIDDGRVEEARGILVAVQGHLDKLGAKRSGEEEPDEDEP